MRIVYLNPGAQMGGAETSLRELLASLRKAEPGWDLVLLVGADGPLVEIAKNLGVRVIVAPLPQSLARLGDSGQRRGASIRQMFKATAGTVRYVRSLAQSLRDVQPDLIHTNGFKMHVLGAWARPQGVPLVWHIHDFVSTRPLVSRLLGFLSGRCTEAIANSQSVAADLRSSCPNLKVVPIHNAIDMQQFAPSGPLLDLDALAGLPAAAAGTVRVGLVATFAHWKGHKVFLQALSQLGTAIPVRGYIVGGPIYQTGGSQWPLQELREEARRAGLAENVGFTGFVDDTAAAMRSLDIVVHASTQPEPFGMVIIEAMACGKPVIVSCAGGAVELFDEGRTALGHTPGDAVDLARQIARLVEDASLRTRLGETARAEIAPIFHGRRLANELTGVYRKCLAARPASASFVPSLNS